MKNLWLAMSGDKTKLGLVMMMVAQELGGVAAMSGDLSQAILKISYYIGMVLAGVGGADVLRKIAMRAITTTDKPTA